MDAVKSIASEYPMLFHPVVLGVGGATLLLIGFLGYMGAFRSVNFTNDKIKKHTFMYIEYVGPYKNLGSQFEKVRLIADDSVTDQSSYIMQGMYFDDPHKVPEDSCRSFVGLAFESKVDDNTFAVLRGKGLQSMDLPAVRIETTTFPFKNSLSFLFAVMKVYPAAHKREEEKKKAVQDKNSTRLKLEGKTEDGECCAKLERYHVDHIQFIFPLEKLDHFVHPKDKDQ